jgi:hypothetical protein
MNTYIYNIYNILIYNILKCVQCVFKVCSFDIKVNTVIDVFKRTWSEHRMNTDNILNINTIQSSVFKVFKI